PVVENPARDRAAAEQTGAVRQVPDGRADEVMRAVEVRERVVLPGIDQTSVGRVVRDGGLDPGERVSDSEGDPSREAAVRADLERVVVRVAVEEIAGDVAVSLIRTQEIGTQNVGSAKSDAGGGIDSRQAGLGRRDDTVRELGWILCRRLE